jgi:hypothetical protein
MIVRPSAGLPLGCNKGALRSGGGVGCIFALHSISAMLLFSPNSLTRLIGRSLAARKIAISKPPNFTTYQKHCI